MATNPIPEAPWGDYLPLGRMTVEQFAALPGEDGWTYELHDGRVIAMPGPGDRHADIQERFFLTVGAFLRAHHLGHLKGTSCYNLPMPQNSEEVRCPDLSFVEPARLATMSLRGSYLVGAPDLVIEIASPNDTRPELARKVIEYLQAGVRLIWIAWPDTETIDVWRPASPRQPAQTLTISDSLDGIDVIPGIQCPVQDIFAN
jgi:Uma2 family endonuclease